MKLFRHILCPVDFSENSQRALGVARALAGDFQAALTVLHVVLIPPPLAAEAPFLPAAFSEGARRRAEEQMAALKRSIDLPGARLEVAEGSVHRTIAERCGEGGADLLVIGTHGLSGFQKLILGSITEKVLHLVRVPVLVVPPGDQTSAACATAAGDRRFARILLAVDFGPSTLATTEHALALARRYRSEILALHACVPLREIYTGPFMWLKDEDLDRLAARGREDLRRRMEDLLPASAVEGTGGVEIQLLEGDASGLITDLARYRDADLVVMGAHGRGHGALGWLGSTCHRVLRTAPCPVLAVRQET